MHSKGIDREVIIKTAAQLANRDGCAALSIKTIADELGIKAPSLYNHISGLEEIRTELMLYGWREMEQEMVACVTDGNPDICGGEAIKAMCRVFYRYATRNKGIFESMIWYNKFSSSAADNATKGLFEVLQRILSSMHINDNTIQHLIRTLRGFLEGFALLVNGNAFGNPVSVEESFELSLDVLIAGIQSLEQK